MKKLLKKTFFNEKENPFFNEKLMLSVVLLNVIVVFLQECGIESVMLNVIDIVCSAVFVVEMVVKHVVLGAKDYWRDGWNVLDGTVTIVTLPALLAYFVPDVAEYSFIIAFRALRVFKLFRTARRFKNITAIWAGFKLALRQSAAFLLGYLVIIVVVAMFNSAVFSHAAPQYFGNPLNGIYAMFQLFTVEGWYEIPNAVVGGMHPVWVHIVRLYFCIILFGGGIIGMSLINSIFVDALAADNNDDVKAQLNEMDRKIEEIRNLLEKNEGRRS